MTSKGGGSRIYSVNFQLLKAICIIKRKAFIKDLVEVDDSVLVLEGPQGNINRAVLGTLNKTIISAGEDIVIHVWDTEA
ncbi:hypothetical protein M8C21_001928 [Ambrosia artemisiifolia]|uniref:Uncharacterized protein n=1 Tax=Ambrosia artemisiifolia TaxID=4212 RepID=A0AAD5GQT7_AMBAR|nr:hypothetical protein M8C21_001928 [Ambrosia artemisiifolia]